MMILLGNIQSTKSISSIFIMSFIKSDSLFSNIINPPFRPDLRLNESSSNIFKSIFENIEPGAKQIRISSVLDFGGTFKPVQQSQYLMNKNQDFFKKEAGTQSYHYNWVVCRNSGLSQDQDNGDECQNQITTHKKEPFLMESEGKSTQQKCQTPVIQNEPVVEPKKIKNETKNIPKNYGKAIISFIEKNRPFIEEITQRFKVDYDQFLWDLKQKKKVINTIADLRTLWSNYKYSKCMRVVSSLFLRKFALKYIFDSRICTYSSHIKYRQRLCEALSDPEQFRHIKDY